MNPNNNEIAKEIAPTKEFFKEIVQETGLSEEKLNQAFPNLDQASNEDTIEPIKTASDQEKINAYDHLETKGLPRKGLPADWKAFLARLKHLEKELANYTDLKAELKTWTEIFTGQSPQQVQEEINNLETENNQNEQSSATKIQALELNLEQSTRENQTILTNFQRKIKLLREELKQWKQTWNNRELAEVKAEWDLLQQRPALSLTEKEFYDDYARRTPLNLAEKQKQELIETNQELEEKTKSLQMLEQKIEQFLNSERTRRYILMRPISSPEKAQQEITELLNKTEQDWIDYLQNGAENYRLKLSMRDENKKNKAQQILTWIKEAKQSQDYQTLFEKWSEGKEYSSIYDFDGSLYLLSKYLEIK